MIPITLAQVCEWTDGQLQHGAAETCVDSVRTDTRQDMPQALFVPLKGERFDAHDFIGQAVDKGAVATLTSRRGVGAAGPQVAAIVVKDTLSALQSLAAHYRAQLSPFYCVGVTGSNGKTSTKDFLSAVFSQKYAVNATKGNLNNHIGLPLTVLSTEAAHTCGIFEMGMNHPGEITPLAAIARPDAAVITNVGTAHIEFMGTREAIAAEKGSLAWMVERSGHVVLNANDDYTPFIAARCRGRVITAGIDAGDVRATQISGSSFHLEANGKSVALTLPVPGHHMIANAVLAAAAGVVAGLSLEEIQEGLAKVRLHGGRLERRRVLGLNFLDDSYNANPDSMRAALATLAHEPCQGRRIAIFGRMGELGIHSECGHRAVGEAAAAADVDMLITVGDDHSRLIHDAFGIEARSLHVSSHREAADWLRTEAESHDLILLKGSRSAAMEKVLTTLDPHLTSSAH